jgi:prepilin-type N-terminal cleavage/methylation domain-containing protein/prepilin-type processing-associated H-X9-DG protein
MQRKNGFTLIELLVVIAIIAILAAILFPVFAQAREKARQTSCLSNGKQIGLSLLMYVQDYDEIFPMLWQNWPNGTWASAVLPYIKNLQIFTCPSRPNRTWSGGPNPRPYGYFDERMGFGCNAHTNDMVGVGSGPCRYYNGSATVGAPLASIVAPAECYMGGDSRCYWPQSYGDNICDQVSAWSWAVMPATRHNKGANMIYCDGHSHVVRRDYLKSLEGQRNWVIDNQIYTTYWPMGGIEADDAPEG